MKLQVVDTTKNKYFFCVVYQVSPVINVQFMKHVSSTENIVNPDIDDISMITDSDIVQVLNEPSFDRKGRMICNDVHTKKWPV